MDKSASFLLFVAIQSLLMTLPFMWMWNYGIVEICEGAKPVDLKGSYLVTLFICYVMNYVRDNK